MMVAALAVVVCFGVLLAGSACAGMRDSESAQQVLLPSGRAPPSGPMVISAECARFAVPPPPPLPPAKAALGAAAVALIRRHGTLGSLEANATLGAFIRACSVEERERLAYEAHSIALYLGPEVTAVQAAEEAAALAAAPSRALAALNGVNIGAGGRPVHPALLLVDAHRALGDAPGELPLVQHAPVHTLMSWADNLPFRPGTLDYAISLHNLEHLEDPVAAVLHYLDLLKPGGGLGVVIPHWQYAWPAHTDDRPWGHRWNTCPELVCELHRHWSHLADLEALNTYPAYRLSFDFVLRKKGTWTPFNQTAPDAKTGAQMAAAGRFLGPMARRALRAVAGGTHAAASVARGAWARAEYLCGNCMQEG
ncbi:MAG: hypothetical protein J3K34DRAFT_523318 [Monoraphidium minutum]|nr:MAG: hypothetical protein J3K34DRAFT_523318 [Monoraphidium minutum]